MTTDDRTPNLAAEVERLRVTPEELVDREERAAVHEYEGGLSREVAEMLAGLRDNPAGITPEIADAARVAPRSAWSSRRPGRRS